VQDLDDRQNPPPRRAPDIASVLEINEIATDVFSGPLPIDKTDRVALYGGQVAAQALLAAGRTVDSVRMPHSLHGYFLRPGKVDREVEYHVDRDRDGRSFSARHVRAMQDGVVIFSMLASFCEASDVEVFDAVSQRALAVAATAPDDTEPYDSVALVDARQITKERALPHSDVDLHPDLFWVRATGAFDNDPLLHAAAMVYLSDMGSGFGQIEDRSIGIGGSSLDHALWFHRQARADDWCLLDMWPVQAMKGLGMYQGSMRTPNGALILSIAQQNLLR
jgi:acyl-CoA thioesterase II